MVGIFLVLLFACCTVFVLAFFPLAEIGEETKAGTLAREQETKIVPLQFVGPASVIFWSEGMWACFLSRAEDVNSNSPARGCIFQQ